MALYRMATLFLAFVAFAFFGCQSLEEDRITGGDIDRTLPLPDGDDEGIDTEIFEVLNLDYPGLEQVKVYYEAGEYYKAAYLLKEYWENRSQVFNTEVDLITTSLTANEQNIADQALEYRFRVSTFCESNPDGSSSLSGDEIFYSFLTDDGIDWTLNDDLALAAQDGFDQEWLFQKHRHQWMEAEAKAYWVSRNEDYVLNWIEVYSDWMEKYPCKMESMPVGGDYNFIDYEWKGLQVAERVLSQLNIIPYCIQSDNFTPEWLCTVLYAFWESVEQIRLNYYDDSNILISQSQAVAYAGILMPEFSKAEEWLQEGSSKLQDQLSQFNEDGVHYQLDPSYHIAAIADYIGISDLFNANGRSDLLGSALERFEKAMTFTADITYPDYSIDNWNDTRASSYTKSVLKRNFSEYFEVFPSNQYFQYMATEGSAGTYPSTYRSEYTYSGWYVMRNGWNSASTMLILKNCYDPDAEWHNQPDNGTFSLWHKGRNFFPDAGVYAYSGSGRTIYAYTTNHNTATIGTQDYGSAYRQGRYLKSGTLSASTEYIVTGHEMAAGVEHRRAIFFVGREFFVIVDDIYGATNSPMINLHFHIVTDESEATAIDRYSDGNSTADVAYYTAGAHTNYTDGNNMLCRTFLEAAPASSGDYNFETLSSDVSDAIGTVSGARVGYRIGCRQAAGASVRFITVIYPFSENQEDISVSASFTDNATGSGALHLSGSAVKVTINGTEYNLSYTL